MFVMKIKYLICCLMVLGVMLPTVILAQGSEIEMADRMREDGKIYVVVAVLSIVFAGIVLYLISLDRKIKKLEKQQKNS